MSCFNFNPITNIKYDPFTKSVLQLSSFQFLYLSINTQNTIPIVILLFDIMFFKKKLTKKRKQSKTNVLMMKIEKQHLSQSKNRFCLILQNNLLISSVKIFSTNFLKGKTQITFQDIKSCFFKICFYSILYFYKIP